MGTALGNEGKTRTTRGTPRPPRVKGSRSPDKPKSFAEQLEYESPSREVRHTYEYLVASGNIAAIRAFNSEHDGMTATGVKNLSDTWLVHTAMLMSGHTPSRSFVTQAADLEQSHRNYLAQHAPSHLVFNWMKALIPQPNCPDTFEPVLEILADKTFSAMIERNLGVHELKGLTKILITEAYKYITSPEATHIDSKSLRKYLLILRKLCKVFTPQELQNAVEGAIRKPVQIDTLFLESKTAPDKSNAYLKVWVKELTNLTSREFVSSVFKKYHPDSKTYAYLVANDLVDPNAQVLVTDHVSRFPTFKDETIDGFLKIQVPTAKDASSAYYLLGIEGPKVFGSLLTRLLREEKYDHLAAIFDAQIEFTFVEDELHQMARYFVNSSSPLSRILNIPIPLIDSMYKAYQHSNPTEAMLGFKNACIAFQSANTRVEPSGSGED